MGGYARLDSVPAQPSAERVAVIRPVRHQPLEPLPRAPRSRGTRILSRVASASFTSARLAPVTRNANGIPSPSVASMRFVPLLTLARPTSSPPLCRNEAAIEERPRPVQLPFLIQASKDCLPDLVPDPFSLPALQPPPRSHIRSVLSRHVLPATPRPQDVQDAVENLTIICPRTARSPSRRQERLNSSPPRIGQFISPHAPAVTDSSVVLKLSLGSEGMRCCQDCVCEEQSRAYPNATKTRCNGEDHHLPTAVAGGENRWRFGFSDLR